MQHTLPQLLDNIQAIVFGPGRTISHDEDQTKHLLYSTNYYFEPIYQRLFQPDYLLAHDWMCLQASAKFLSQDRNEVPL